MHKTQAQIIEKTIDFVKHHLQNAEAGHDWWHIYRVWNNAKYIAQNETCNAYVVELAALLHDIADSKFHDGNEEIGPIIAEKHLHSLQVNHAQIESVLHIIKNISYKNTLSNTPIHYTPELNIVMDADRLDAMGAIGIARTFNYGGYKNRAIYDPSIKPEPNQTKEAYKKSNAPTINHFYEKLLLLKGLMQTQTGRILAEERHQFMLTYLRQFYKEWDCTK